MADKKSRGRKVPAGPLEVRTFSDTLRLIRIERIAKARPDPDKGLRSMDMEGRHRLMARFRRR
jgi:hypothetical protein